jgi:Flp pilus assembly protein TadG
MKINREESGQALIELSIVLVILCVFVFGIIDFGRAVYDVQVMKNLAGEGSSMASRGAAPATTATAVVAYAGADINLNTNGCVVVTVVAENSAGTAQVVTAQSWAGKCGTTMASNVGCLSGQGSCKSSVATLPTTAANALQQGVAGTTLYVTEVFYAYNTITPIPNFLGSGILPSQLYSVAYY